MESTRKGKAAGTSQVSETAQGHLGFVAKAHPGAKRSRKWALHTQNYALIDPHSRFGPSICGTAESDSHSGCLAGLASCVYYPPECRCFCCSLPLCPAQLQDNACMAHTASREVEVDEASENS